MYGLVAPTDPRLRPRQPLQQAHGPPLPPPPPSSRNVQPRPHPQFGEVQFHHDPSHFSHVHSPSPAPMPPPSPTSPAAGMMHYGPIRPPMMWGGPPPVPLPYMPLPPPPLPFSPRYRYDHHPQFRYPPPFPIPFQPLTRTGMGTGPRGIMSHDPRGGCGMSSLEKKDPFIEEWLKGVIKNKPIASKMQSTYKIPEVRSLLKKGAELLSHLRSTHSQMNSIPLDDGIQWHNLKMKAELSKKEFLDIRCKLDRPELKEHMVTRATKLRKKRERQKRSWMERKKAWQEKREGLEKMTEDWVKEREEKDLKAKMEKNVQASAGGVLEEVKRKTVEVKQLLELAEAVKELRSLRREASRKKGDAPPIEADEAFSENHVALVDMLTRQSGVYESEEHALRVLMEEEVKEKIHTHHSNVAKARSHHFDLILSTSASMTSDPMEPYKRFYLQADDSKEIMNAIRSDWDVFLCPEGSMLPSTPELVAPTPSSLAWDQCRVKDRPLEQST